MSTFDSVLKIYKTASSSKDMSKSHSNTTTKNHESKSDASPTSIVSHLPCETSHGSDLMNERGDNFTLTPSSYHINLEKFIKRLPDTIRNSTSSSTSKPSTYMDDGSDHIASLFRRLTISNEELKPYCFIEENKNYTRNLIATDDETFTLLLLCWNPGKYSPIHDHPCNGCWMRVCQGCVNEVQYRREETQQEERVGGTDTHTFGDDNNESCSSSSSSSPSTFVCTMDTTFNEGEQTYIDDYLGYHKVGNPSNDLLAVSMHLYSPPFEKCKIWMNSYDASASSISRMCNFSEYGHRVKK